MTYQEVISNLQNIRRGGRRSQDELIDDNQLAFNIDMYRAKLIAQEFEKGERIASIVIQPLRVKLIRDTAMQDDLGKSCKVYSAVIPKVVETAYRPLLQSVRLNPLSRGISIVSQQSLRDKLKSPLTGKMDMVMYQEKKLYIVTQNLLDFCFVDAVFERPLDVQEFKDVINPYAPYDFEYPISGTMLSTLYDLLTTKELRLAMSVPNDLQANGQVDSATQQTQSAQ